MSGTVNLVMVEREVAFPNSNTKPCLILSHHTAPDVDTPFDIGNRVTTSCFVTSTFRAKYNIVVFKLAIVVNTPNCRHLYIHTVTSGHILTITVRHWLSVTSFPLKRIREISEAEVTELIDHAQRYEKLARFHAGGGTETGFELK
ncbi:hypothetical protein [Limnospira platensis]|uniref:hypothetical protein n=1 Tax=Limnospira platensis TaxID=118562 RepID=UPI003D6E6CED